MVYHWYKTLERLWRLSFFIQAEDGIRARNVTGVQTCALPISHRRQVTPGVHGVWADARVAWDDVRRARSALQPRVGCELRSARDSMRRMEARDVVRRDEIGRASCRERVVIWRVAETLEE